MFPPVESDVAISQKHGDGTTSLEQLTEGYNLYKNKCGSCHYLYRPDKFSEAKWKEDIAEMGQKARLNSKEIASIEHYILTARETGSFAHRP